MTAQTTCPRCKWNLLKSVAARNATSRRDNKTRICSECGTAEALEDSKLMPQWLDDPTHRPYWDTKSDVWLVQAEKREDAETGIDELKADAEWDALWASLDKELS